MSTAPAAGPRGGVSRRAVAQVCRALARGVAAAASASSSPRLESLRTPRREGDFKRPPGRCCSALLAIEAVLTSGLSAHLGH